MGKHFGHAATIIAFVILFAILVGTALNNIPEEGLEDGCSDQPRAYSFDERVQFCPPEPID